MYKRVRGKCQIEYYESIADFLKVVDSREYNYHAETRRVYGNKRFTGVSDYDEALSLLKHGYSKPIKAMDGVRTASGEDSRPRFHNVLVGEAVVVPLALAGVPTCMTLRDPQPVTDRVVKLLVDVGRSSVVRAPEIEDWGKNIVALVRAIENSGRRVELHVLGTVCDWYGSSPLYAFRLPIKRASEPLDIKRICFPLLHPAFQRVFKFDWFDRLPDSEPVWGYGSATAYHMDEPEHYRDYIAPVLERGEHLINLFTNFDELKRSL